MCGSNPLLLRKDLTRSLLFPFYTFWCVLFFISLVLEESFCYSSSQSQESCCIYVYVEHIYIYSCTFIVFVGGIELRVFLLYHFDTLFLFCKFSSIFCNYSDMRYSTF